MTEYMTTKELAEFLRIKQRKVYALAASGRVPCSRAMGKLLFPRAEVEAWVAAGGVGFAAPGAPASTAPAPAPTAAKDRPQVFLGSHDPLLEWALRQSRCGLATYFDGSIDGLDRFAAGEGIATGLHMFDPGGSRDAGDDAAWNIGWVRRRVGAEPCALVEFAWRERGLITRPDQINKIASIADMQGRLIVPRQPEAGSRALLEHLLAEAGLGDMDYVMADPARTETEAAETVASLLGEVAFGLRASARQFHLDFQPILRERFDLLVDRKAWFDPPFQRFLAFCRTEEFRFKAETLTGYDVSGLGTVHFNGS